MRRHLVMVGVALAVLAGCSSEPDLGPVFNDEAGAPAGCLSHQEGEPGTRYLAAEQRNTGQVLALMKYYTQFGTMPFCDGEPPNDSDRVWAQTYVDLGGSADKAATALG